MHTYMMSFLNDQRGGPMDPTFVYRAFYYFRLRFLDRSFFLLSIGYASLDAKKKKKLNQPRRFLAN